MDKELVRMAEEIRANFDAKEEAREKALASSRSAIKSATGAVRAIHKREYKMAEELLAEARRNLDQSKQRLASYPDIYHAGFIHDSSKEYAEAAITESLILGKPFPSPSDLNVEYAAYLSGMGEAIGELRRNALDSLGADETARAEELLNMMDDLYYFLASFTYPDAISPGLRRIVDVARSIMEKTRGDIVTALGQRRLRDAIGDTKKE
ncbi:MAG: haloacid dehalogenase [Actinomycetota bacterium]|nr:haloacid dehalogenase [Actinomycetota bacterium]